MAGVAALVTVVVTVAFAVNVLQGEIHSGDDEHTEYCISHNNPSSYFTALIFPVNTLKYPPEFAVHGVKIVRKTKARQHQ